MSWILRDGTKTTRRHFTNADYPAKVTLRNASPLRHTKSS